MDNYKVKPFVKWVGGKTQLLDVIELFIKDEKIERIVEPFVGGGAFFLSQNKPFLINDLNNELIISYKQIRNNSRKLMKLLTKYESLHSEDFYYSKRGEDVSKLDSLEKSSRFIYLNKAGFNGMYRVNSNGGFNVPSGKKESVRLYEKSNLVNLSNYLKDENSLIMNEDYKKTFELAKDNDFFFIDPPYDKETKSSFTAYNKNNFLEKQQRELYKQIEILENKGIKFILTNHDTELINYLYKEFNIYKVRVNRMINSNGDNRSNATFETIITNIEISKKIKKELDFIDFIKTMKSTNNLVSELVNWEKVCKNTDAIEFELNQLNYLMSSTKGELMRKVEELYNREKPSKSSFKVLSILLAVREGDKEVIIGEDIIRFKNIHKRGIDYLKEIIVQSGLINIFLNNRIKDLKDYTLGIEAGLDSNTRKNRTGHNYEKQISRFLERNNIKYESEYTLSSGNEKRRYDFLMYLNGKKYLLQVNFYNTSGSKLNEICRSYINLQNEFNNDSILEGYEFIWITDGKGWMSTKNSLRDAYFKVEKLFNFDNFKNWVNNKLG